MTDSTPPRLQFLGATDCVTASRFLLESQGQRILVDCGLFQGYKHLRDRNHVPLPVPPWSTSDALLTHAHLDHSGYVPALVRKGFTGRVHATAGTAVLCNILLPDGHLQEKEARETQHRGSSHHRPPRPLFVLIAAFAVGRSKTILLHLSRLLTQGRFPKVPVYLNSPMAVDASFLYQRFREEHRLPDHEYKAMYNLAIMTRTADDSRLLDLRGGPMIIISASGMPTGGRILHHLESYASDKKNAIILTGYQAGGTRGADLLNGVNKLRIYGRDVPIAADLIQIEGLSAHADSDDLLTWMRTATKAPRMTSIIHGGPQASDVLRVRIKRELGWPARVPEYLETISLDKPH